MAIFRCFGGAGIVTDDEGPAMLPCLCLWLLQILRVEETKDSVQLLEERLRNAL